MESLEACAGNLPSIILINGVQTRSGANGGDILPCLSEVFVKDHLGTPRFFLGIQIERNGDKIIIHQRSYIRRLLERFDAPEVPVATPLDPKQPLVEASETELLNEKMLWNTALQWEF